MTTPSFYGHVRDITDADVIFAAAKEGRCALIYKRLHYKGDKIQAGQGYVYDEVKSKIKRWTDGFNWGDSYHPGGKIMIYKEVDIAWEDDKVKKIDKPNGLRKKTIADPNSNLRIVSYYYEPPNHCRLPFDIRIVPPSGDAQRITHASPPGATVKALPTSRRVDVFKPSPRRSHHNIPQRSQSLHASPIRRAAHENNANDTGRDAEAFQSFIRTVCHRASISEGGSPAQSPMHGKPPHYDYDRRSSMPMKRMSEDHGDSLRGDVFKKSMRHSINGAPTIHEVAIAASVVAQEEQQRHQHQQQQNHPQQHHQSPAHSQSHRSASASPAFSGNRIVSEQGHGRGSVYGPPGSHMYCAPMPMVSVQYADEAGSPPSAMIVEGAGAEVKAEDKESECSSSSASQTINGRTLVVRGYSLDGPNENGEGNSESGEGGKSGGNPQKRMSAFSIESILCN
eukprot:Nk52_evm52s266 gene=Nk52_evmTU52s266